MSIRGVIAMRSSTRNQRSASLFADGRGCLIIFDGLLILLLKNTTIGALLLGLLLRRLGVLKLRWSSLQGYNELLTSGLARCGSNCAYHSSCSGSSIGTTDCH